MNRPLFAALSLVSLLSLLSTTHTLAATCPTEVRVQSTPYAVAIAELYTSEGCDSCPPADKWLGTLAPTASARQPVIPLAFHVDYWDYIGWRDPFAQPLWATRQGALVQAAGKRTVYTPQVFLNGRDVGLWSNQRAFQQAVGSIAGRPATVDISLSVRNDGKQLQTNIDVKPTSSVAQSDLALYIALTERNLVSSVKAGENRGVTLHHDHVVHQLLGPLAIGGAAATDRPQSIPLAANWKHDDLGVVAFVQNRRSGDVLQAVSAQMCK